MIKKFILFSILLVSLVGCQEEKNNPGDAQTHACGDEQEACCSENESSTPCANGLTCNNDSVCMKPEITKTPGTKDNVCRDDNDPKGACDTGLKCVTKSGSNQKTCVKDLSGTKGNACREIAQGVKACDEGLECVTDPQTQEKTCLDTKDYGKEGKSCKAQGVCDTGLECSTENVCEVPKDPGTEGGTCIKKDAQNNPTHPDTYCTGAELFCVKGLCVVEANIPESYENGPCADQDKCHTGLSCVNEKCVMPEKKTYMGYCDNVVQEDQKCNPGLKCNTDFVCVYKEGAEHGTCRDHRDCDEGLLCNLNNICQKKSEVGENCFVHENCATDTLFCNNQNVCENRATGGESCNETKLCVNDYFCANNTVCRLKQPENGFCIENYECQEGLICRKETDTSSDKKCLPPA